VEQDADIGPASALPLPYDNQYAATQTNLKIFMGHRTQQKPPLFKEPTIGQSGLSSAISSTRIQKYNGSNRERGTLFQSQLISEQEPSSTIIPGHQPAYGSEYESRIIKLKAGPDGDAIPPSALETLNTMHSLNMNMEQHYTAGDEKMASPPKAVGNSNMDIAAYGTPAPLDVLGQATDPSQPTAATQIAPVLTLHH